MNLERWTQAAREALAQAQVLARAKEAGLPLFRAGQVSEGEGVYFLGAPVKRRGYAHF
mgnify:CR=1 FL=1